MSQRRHQFVVENDERDEWDKEHYQKVRRRRVDYLHAHTYIVMFKSPHNAAPPHCSISHSLVKAIKIF